MFRLSPDRAHALANWALRWEAPWRLLAELAKLQVHDARLRTNFAGIELANPIGLAAGFDKDCDLLPALSWFGFGSLTCGSIMPAPRYGNPFPRLVRYPDTESLADSMGVPSKGRDYAVARLARLGPRRVPIFANIGGFSADELAQSYRAVSPHVDAVEISLMCPNTKKREDFDPLLLLHELLTAIGERPRPMVVRVPNDVAASDDLLRDLIERCVAARVDGLKVGGGRPVAEPQLGSKQGTLHGRAIFDAAIDNVARAAQIARGRIPIRGNGGVSSGADVLAMLRAGACCVDLYSAFIYQGWNVAADINRQLLALLDRAAAPSLSDLVAATTAA